MVQALGPHALVLHGREPGAGEIDLGLSAVSRLISASAAGAGPAALARWEVLTRRFFSRTKSMNRLRDYIRKGCVDQLRKDAQAKREPLPPGAYPLDLLAGTPIEADDHDAPELEWRVADGVHQGRRVFHRLKLAGASLPYAIAHLDTLGISIESLDSRTLKPLLVDSPAHGSRFQAIVPIGLVIEATVTQWTGDDGKARNQIERFGAVVTPAPNLDEF